MQEVIQSLIDIGLVHYGLYVTVWCFTCALFTALTPATLTQKIPNFIMVIINVSALNVNNASNLLTDINGNKVDGDITKDT